MVSWWLLIAQVAQTDPISGGAGWVGAGLLGLVLAWLLLKHLPEKDRQVRDLIDSQRAELKETRKEYKEALDVVLAHCEREVLKISDAFRHEVHRVADGLHKGTPP